MKNLIALVFVLCGTILFAQKKELSLDQAVLPWMHNLSPESISALQWVDGTSNYIYKEKDYYIIKNASGTEVQKVSIEDFQMAYSEMKALPRLMHVDAREMVFHYNGDFVHFDYANKKSNGITSYPKTGNNQDYLESKMQLAYTIDNNLFISMNDEEQIAVTSIKDKNIVSGQAIHRYEFGISKGTFWSPNGNFLAFYQKDETNVTDYPLVDVTTYPASLMNVKYPMAGQKSEMAKVGIFNVSTKSLLYLDIDTKDEHYLTNLVWSPDEKYVFLAEVNRAQDNYKYNCYDAKTGKFVRTIFEESNDRWVEPENDAVFLPNSNTSFLWLSEKDGFKNLYLYDINGKTVRQLTHFKFVIKDILGVHPSGKYAYVSATGEDARNTHVYQVSLTRSDKYKNLTPTSGVHHAQLSSNGAYLIDNYSSLTIPRKIDIVSTKSGKAKNILTAEDPLKDYEIGTTEFNTHKSKEGFDLYSRTIKPANFDSTKKYPVLIYVYGGTHAQLVTNNWLGGASLWMHWMATQEDYIIYTVDNRGSANRGFAYESIIHRQAGEAAMEDQMVGVDYLKSLPYVDSERIAVHGWSYGGFMASSLILRHPGVFTTSVAGGPVIDWAYYEVMYGERYMDTPQENPEGYEKSLVSNYIENLDGKLLLITGSIDPTVLPQHSMMLLSAAVEKGVQVDFFSYPMHEHNVRGKDRVHLIEKILLYVVENNQ